MDAVVLTDSYAWHETCNDPTTPRHDAVKGEKIEVSQEEFDRAQAMLPVALAKPGSDEAKVATGELPEPDAPLTAPDGSDVGPVAKSDKPAKS